MKVQSAVKVLEVTSISIVDIEVTDEPLMIFFRLVTRDNGGRQVTVMKSYEDLATLFHLLHFPPLQRPRVVSEAALKKDPHVRKLQSHLDCLVRNPHVLRLEPVLEFFHMCDEYQASLDQDEIKKKSTEFPSDNVKRAPLTRDRVVPKSSMSEPSALKSPPSTSSTVCPPPCRSGLWDPTSEMCEITDDLDDEFLCEVATTCETPPLPLFDRPVQMKREGHLSDINEEVRTAESARKDTFPKTRCGSMRKTQQRSKSSTRGRRPQCVICMCQPEEVAVDPCGHVSMCRHCSELVSQCPVCRAPINKLLRVYVVI